MCSRTATPAAPHASPTTRSPPAFWVHFSSSNPHILPAKSDSKSRQKLVQWQRDGVTGSSDRCTRPTSTKNTLSHPPDTHCPLLPFLQTAIHAIRSTDKFLRERLHQRRHQWIHDVTGSQSPAGLSISGMRGSHVSGESGPEKCINQKKGMLVS